MNELAQLEQTFASLDEETMVLGIAFLGTLAIAFVVIAIIWFFVSAIGYRKVFQKAGEAGWKAFIPVYRDYICFGFSWNHKAFWICLAAGVVFDILSTIGILVLELVAIAGGIVWLVFMLKCDIRIARSFGKGTGCGVLLFFFPFIVSLVLGYGKAQYLGNTTVTPAE